MISRLAVGAGAIALVGCSGAEVASSPSSAADPCRLTVALGGDVEQAIDWSGSTYCDSARGGDAVALLFGYDEETNATGIRLQLQFIMTDPTSTGSTAPTVEVHGDCSPTTGCERWTTPLGSCAVNVTAHSLHHEEIKDDYYRITGTGTCPEPAVQLTGSSEVVVGPLSFDATHVFAPKP